MDSVRVADIDVNHGYMPLLNRRVLLLKDRSTILLTKRDISAITKVIDVVTLARNPGRRRGECLHRLPGEGIRGRVMLGLRVILSYLRVGDFLFDFQKV